MSNRPWLTGLTSKSLPRPTDSSALGPQLSRTAQHTPHPRRPCRVPACLSPRGSPARSLAGLRPLCGSPCLFPAAVPPPSRHTCLGPSLQPGFLISGPGSRECLGKWSEQWPGLEQGCAGAAALKPRNPVGVEQGPDQAVSCRSRKPSTCLCAGMQMGRPLLSSRSTCPGFLIISGECAGGKAKRRVLACLGEGRHSLCVPQSAFQGGLFSPWTLCMLGLGEPSLCVPRCLGGLLSGCGLWAPDVWHCLCPLTQIILSLPVGWASMA